jgi:hypothetical protein
LWAEVVEGDEVTPMLLEVVVLVVFLQAVQTL